MDEIPGFKKKAFTMSYDDAVQQDKRLRVSNDGKIYFNPTSTTLYFDVHFKLYELKPGETLVIEE